MSNTVPDSQRYPAESIPGDNIRAGMWLSDPAVATVPVLVEAVADTRDPNGYVMALVVINGHPVPVTLSPTDPVRLATDAEIEAAKSEARRTRMADALFAFAHLVRDTDVPLGKYPHLTLRHDLTRAQLHDLADRLGLKVERDFHNHAQVVWPAQRASYDDFHVEWTATYTEAEMAAEGLDLMGKPLPARPKPKPPAKATGAKAAPAAPN